MSAPNGGFGRVQGKTRELDLRSKVKWDLRAALGLREKTLDLNVAGINCKVKIQTTTTAVRYISSSFVSASLRVDQRSWSIVIVSDIFK